jgi:Zn-dependent protease
MDVANIARSISIYAVPVLMAVILHEVAHGWVAEKFGDSTARRAGRLTLNPLSHIDPIGTVLLPLILIAVGSKYLFGWAKPVPVNFSALRNPKRDMIWVALSGPGTNFFLALFSALALRLIIFFEPNAVMMADQNVAPAALREMGVAVSVLTPIALMLVASIWINCVLMVLNLIPVPPLDGGRVLVGILPPRAAYTYSKVEPFGFLIVVLLVFMLPQSQAIFYGIIRLFVSLFFIVASY